MFGKGWQYSHYWRDVLKKGSDFQGAATADKFLDIKDGEGNNYTQKIA